jgi:hypothetical protein
MIPPILARSSDPQPGAALQRAVASRRLPATVTQSEDLGMGNLQRMAMQMQQQMGRIQAELAETEVEGSAGGGVVKAVVTGTQQLKAVSIDPSAVDPDDVEMLQDLVTAAVNEALEASRKLAESKMGGIAGGLGGLLGR